MASLYDQLVRSGIQSAPRFTTGVTQKKKTRATDPYDALGGFSALQNAYLQAASQGAPMAPPVDYDSLRAQANTAATLAYQPQVNAIQQERGYQQARQNMSAEAAGNFAAALAKIFTGGNAGQAGEEYSLKNFGGSYLAGMAASIGTQLISQQRDYFNKQDYDLANQLSELQMKHPQEAERIYADLVSGEEERMKNQQSILDADYRTKLAALASAITFDRQNRQDRSLDEHRRRQDATAAIKAATSGQKQNKLQVIYGKDGAIYKFDPVTGSTTLAIPGQPKPKEVKTRVVEQKNGDLMLVNSQTGEKIAVVGHNQPSSSTRRSGGGGGGNQPEPPSASAQSEAIGRAERAADDVMTNIRANIWDKMPGSTDAEKTAAEGAYRQSGQSFKTAFARVVKAISPHLRAIGYTPAQVRQKAYDLVRQQFAPPRGYRRP